MAGKKHPGKISYYELINGEEKLVNVEAVKDVPEGMRFRKDASGKDVPVVKTVAIKNTDGRVQEIVEYGPKGQFLSSTMAQPPPRSPTNNIHPESNPIPKPVKAAPTKES